MDSFVCGEQLQEHITWSVAVSINHVELVIDEEIEQESVLDMVGRSENWEVKASMVRFDGWIKSGSNWHCSFEKGKLEEEIQWEQS